jgi:hypothetical protein
LGERHTHKNERTTQQHAWRDRFVEHYSAGDNADDWDKIYKGAGYRRWDARGAVIPGDRRNKGGEHDHEGHVEPIAVRHGLHGGER